jgi:hypothetical protein
MQALLGTLMRFASCTVVCVSQQWVKSKNFCTLGEEWRPVLGYSCSDGSVCSSFLPFMFPADRHSEPPALGTASPPVERETPHLKKSAVQVNDNLKRYFFKQALVWTARIDSHVFV